MLSLTQTHTQAQTRAHNTPGTQAGALAEHGMQLDKNQPLAS